MSLKHFQAVKLGIVVALGLIASSSIVRQNYIWPIMAMAVATLVLVLLRGKVKGVIADERDYEIGGKATRWAIQLFGWFSAVMMFVLYAQRAVNPSYETIASVLAYSVCFLLIVYSLLFRYYEKIVFFKDKTRAPGVSGPDSTM